MHYKLNIKSLDSITLQLYIKFLKVLFSKLNIKKLKYIFMPKKKKRITLLKSSHVHKKAREQFEIVQHKALIVIPANTLLKLVPYLLINKPKHVKIRIISVV